MRIALLSLLLPPAALAVCPPLATVSTTATDDTTASGNDFAPDRFSCSPGGAAQDLAFRWVAPTDGVFVIDTEGSAIHDSVLIVLDELCETELACDDDDGTGFLSSMQFLATAGTAYTIVVDGWAASNVGPIQLNITPYAPVCGDGMVEGAEQCDDGNTAEGDGCDALCLVEANDCTMDDSIGSLVGTAIWSADTCAGSDSVRSDTCGGGQREPDQVVAWTAPATDVYAISLSSDHDSALTIQSTDCVELSCSDDDGPASAPGTQFAAIAGETYHIVADGFGSSTGDCGPVSLNILPSSLCADPDLDGTCDFVLTTDDPVPGSPMTLEVVGAPEGATVYFLVSGRIDPSRPLCHPAAPVCTPLQTPNVLHTEVADATGQVVFTATVPPLPSGIEVHVHSAWIMGDTGAVSAVRTGTTP